MPTLLVLNDMMMGDTLGQLRPADTTAVTIYSPVSGVHTKITRVVVCNTASTTQKFRIFLDNDGTTYDETTALFWDIPTPTDTTVEIEGGWWMNNSSGNLAVRTDSASAFTFTVFGVENTA